MGVFGGYVGRFLIVKINTFRKKTSNIVTIPFKNPLKGTTPPINPFEGRGEGRDTAISKPGIVSYTLQNLFKHAFELGGLFGPFKVLTLHSILKKTSDFIRKT